MAVSIELDLAVSGSKVSQSEKEILLVGACRFAKGNIHVNVMMYNVNKVGRIIHLVVVCPL